MKLSEVRALDKQREKRWGGGARLVMIYLLVRDNKKGDLELYPKGAIALKDPLTLRARISTEHIPPRSTTVNSEVCHIRAVAKFAAFVLHTCP